ncbi:hypothetical protein C9374_011939 [Naegleria lovaniensis]|uniref:Coiled-coil domain-containing protein 112 n=1 Tax=Naegleria lovaniensis TaxID=51637 RepID=A0AA88G8P4_NAELO|nr:uncharacterized protein C9374_011939 [Naegleria lovaniensis]KAG2373650.1 hypothetical protein C9374_011939 [Naegleria lovaniensis]
MKSVQANKQARTLWLSQYKALKSKLSDMKDFFNEIQCTEGLQRQKQLEERKECLEDIQDISKRVSSLKRMTVESKTIPQENTSPEQQEEFLNRIQSVMERIEKQCIVFKQTRRQMLQTLNTEEKILMKEITSFEGLIDDPDWLKEKEEPESIFTNPEKMKAVKQYIEQRENLRVPMEVIDYDNYVAQHGGLTGGWDAEDHTLFVKLKTKYPDPQLFISKAVEEIKTHSIIEIQEHDEFYKNLMILQNQKKTAIQRWKEEKKKKKEEQIEIEEQDKVKLLEKEEEERQKEAQRQKQLTKIKLQTWKIEKERLEKEKQELEEREKQEKLNKQKEEERRYREVTKLHLESYKQLKEIKQKEKQKVLVEELSKKTRPPSPAELARVREREEQYVKKALERKLKREQEAKEKEERLSKLKEKVKVEVESDATRLLKPTQAQFNREVEIREYMAQPKDEGSGRRPIACDVRMISHKTIPSWRK